MPRFRLGPRPLPQHLGLAATSWLNSAAALPALKLASSNWAKPESGSPPKPNPQDRPPENALRGKIQAVLREAEAADPAALAESLRAEGLRRFDRLLTGIENYRRHPYRREVPEPPPLWSEGTTRLLDYRASATPEDAPRLLVIPSLVNRYYILDLDAETSFLRYMAGQGMAPCAVDWGAPGDIERRFGFAEYIERLERAFETLRARPGGPIVVIGYCMGGNLALALALRRQREIAGLVALATPWDFHAENAEHARALAAVGGQLEPILRLFGELPVDILQSFFSGFDPFQVPRKFQNFAALDADSAGARKFVALEDWLNDGTALAAEVARECLIGWYGENRTARGEWRIGGEPVEPRRFTRPSLNVIPAGDRIVPPMSALALAAALPDSDTLRPAAGHIGMMAGRGARPLVWEPMARWIRGLAG